MSYLFVELIAYLLAALVLGLLLGWMTWGWRRQSAAAVVDPGAERLAADLDAGRSELARLRSELASSEAKRRDAEARAASLASAAPEATPDPMPKTAAAAATGGLSADAAAAQVASLKARIATLETALSARAEPKPGSAPGSAPTTTPAPRRAGPTAGAGLAGEIARAQGRAAQAEQALRDLRRTAGAAAQAAADHKALQARADQLEDDLADARRLAESARAEASTGGGADGAVLAELDALKAELDRHATARKTLVADLETARAQAAAAEQELAALRAAAAESDAEVGAASPQPLLTPSSTDSDDGDPDDAPAEAGGEVDPDAVGDRPQLLDAPRDNGPDDLKLIKGVGKKLEEILHDLGIYHFDQIASWSEREAAWVDARLRFRGRIARDGWIGQAKTLAEGGETEFSKKVSKGGVYD